MACITIAQTSCRQVEHPDKEGKEQAILITVRGHFVKCMNDTGRIVLVKRKCIQQRMDTGHQHSGGGALTADIANTEE